MITKELASQIIIGLNIAYERSLPKEAIDTVLLICGEFEAAQHSVQADGGESPAKIELTEKEFQALARWWG